MTECGLVKSCGVSPHKILAPVSPFGAFLRPVGMHKVVEAFFICCEEMGRRDEAQARWVLADKKIGSVIRIRRIKVLE